MIHSAVHPDTTSDAHRRAASAPGGGPPLVSARGLFLSRNGRAILEGIDLDVAAGEIVTLIGPNGAGKTTLVRVLLGLEMPDRGEVKRRADVRIGYVPQRFAVDPAMPLTVARFLALGRDAGSREIAGALADVGAAHASGLQMSRLSGGEMQRVLLARALLRQPNLLVLDEPASGVDYMGEADLYALIGRLSAVRGFGVLLVSHDLHVVMAASDRVLCLNRHVCCSGVPEAVSQHPEYVRLFGPEAARAIAVYHHHHDHAHDLAGGPVVPGDGAHGAHGSHGHDCGHSHGDGHGRRHGHGHGHHHGPGAGIAGNSGKAGER